MCLYHMFLITVTSNCVRQTYIQIYPCVRFMLCNLGSVVNSKWFPWSPPVLGMVNRVSMDFIVIAQSQLCVKTVNHYCSHCVQIMCCWNRWYLCRTIAPSNNNTECHERNHALNFRTSQVFIFNYHLLQNTCFFDVTCSICFVVFVYLTGRWQSSQLQYTRICVWLWFSLCLYVGAIGINLFDEMTKDVRTVLMVVTIQNTVLSGVHTIVW